MSEPAFLTSALSDDLPGGLLPAEPVGGPVESGAHGATPMAKKISGSVGKGGKNKPEAPTEDGSQETYLQTLPDEGHGMMAKPAPDALMFDMPGEPTAVIGVLVGLLLPAVQKVEETNPEMPSTPMIPPVDKVIDQPADSEQEEDAATGFSDFDLSAGETFEAMDQISLNFEEIKYSSDAAEGTNPEGTNLFAAGLAEIPDQIEFNYIEIKGSSTFSEAMDPDDLLPADGVGEDAELDQIIEESTRTYGDKEKPNDLLIGGDGADVLSETAWFEFVDDVLV